MQSLSLASVLSEHTAKRYDAIRSDMMSSSTKTLDQGRFIAKTQHGLDVGNRAYYMVIAIQQWLGTRLDLLGNVLVLGIGLFASGFSNTVDPSKVGVVLTYTLSSMRLLILFDYITHN